MEFNPSLWQTVVFSYLQDFKKRQSFEETLSLPDYDRNKELSMWIKMSKQSGHSTLASVIASLNDSVLIYSGIDHYRNLNLLAERHADGLGSKCECISIFEIYHTLTSFNKSPAQHDRISELKIRFGSPNLPKVVVVDEASSLMLDFKEVVDWIYQVSTGPIVFLG